MAYIAIKCFIIQITIDGYSGLENEQCWQQAASEVIKNTTCFKMCGYKSHTNTQACRQKEDAHTQPHTHAPFPYGKNVCRWER